MRKNLIILFSLFCIFILPTLAKADDTFDPNNIISDFEINDYTSMTLEQIQAFLDDKDGYLADYTCEDPDGNKMTAAEVIYERSRATRINPKFVLVLLQKEMSLVEDKDPKKSQLDWATGYGCFDGSACNPRWKGFYKQVNSATLQFRSYMEEPHLYTYRAGGTYEFTNPYSTIKDEINLVTPLNQATASLYNYTPHVYNGNYNFYKIWQRYFTKTYPDGSLLQAEGEVGVWLIQNGVKRPFLTKGALTSRYNTAKIITVNPSDLDAYEKGAPIKFPNYSVIRSPRGELYLLVDDYKKKFADNDAFRNVGINPEEVLSASWEDITAYKDGKTITASSTYPTGALLQNNKTGGVYWVIEGEKSPLIDSIFLKTLYKDKKIIQVTPEELDLYVTVDPIIFGNGELIKSPSSPAVYLIDNGQKRPFLRGEDFVSMGYKWENIITATPQILYLYPLGEPVTLD